MYDFPTRFKQVIIHLGTLTVFDNLPITEQNTNIYKNGSENTNSNVFKNLVRIKEWYYTIQFIIIKSMRHENMWSRVNKWSK